MGEYIESKNAPPHLFIPGATHMLTACTYQRLNLLDNDKKKYLLETLFEIAKKLGWKLEAWVILDNHYHIITRAPDEGYEISNLIQPLHSLTAKFINRSDQVRGRKVWQNYWDTCLTHEKSYLARLHYVLMNPVKHGLVNDPVDYPFSSYRWFIERAGEELRRKVFASPINRLSIEDDF